MTEDCTLCGFPTPAPPVTASTVTGSYCCRGCLEVARALGPHETPETPAHTTEPPISGRPDETPADLADAYLEVDGMHCTTCETFLSLRGRSHDGIHSVEASYATDTVRVRYDPTRIDAAAIPNALSGAGYEARFRNDDPRAAAQPHAATATRLLVGGFFTMLLMPWYVLFLYPSYVGIETGIMTIDMTTTFGLYLPMALIGLFATVVVFYTGWPILRGAYVSIRTRQPNMDLLLAVAILAAYIYSTVAVTTGSIHLYYDVAAAIVMVVTAGRYYEGRIKQAAIGRLSDLVTMRVTEATRLTDDGTTETVDVDQLEAGDTVIVRPGDRVPVDGTVHEGTASVDEALLTGESLPTTRRPGDTVVGGSVVTDSALVVTVGDDAESLLDRLTSMVWAVQSERSGVQRFVDRLATVFVPVVLVVGFAVAAWWIVTGHAVSAAVLAGLTVLVVACPCAMGLATPLALASGLRDAFARGIVATNSSLFETAPRVETVVFDKTGTLTTGEMTVQSVHGDASVLPLAAAIEDRSSHPVATAIVDHVNLVANGGSIEDVQAHPSDATSVTEFERHPGQGVSGRVNGEFVVVGTPALVEEMAGPVEGALRAAVEDATVSGQLPVVIGRGDRAEAVVTVGDRPRDGWEQALAAFDDRRVVLLTGDDAAAAARYGQHPAVDDVFAGVPPDGKVAAVERLSADGPTAMIGDGTNDAPALGAADVGIAMAGTAHAADAADVVLVDARLEALPVVFDLATGTRRRIRENVGWAFGYNAIAIPLAVAGLLNPLLAAIAMATSSVLVVTNSRRPVL